MKSIYERLADAFPADLTEPFRPCALTRAVRREVRQIPVSLIDYDRLPLGPAGFATATALAAGVEMPPVHVQVLPGGRYRLCDGRHRLLAHKILGRETIAARAAWNSPRRSAAPKVRPPQEPPRRRIPDNWADALW